VVTEAVQADLAVKLEKCSKTLPIWMISCMQLVVEVAGAAVVVVEAQESLN
jgi:hypothetical protein